MRLKYAVVKELCQLIAKARIKIRSTKNVSENLRRLKWSDEKRDLTLKDFQYHFMDICNIPNTQLLDEVIGKLEELIKSKSKIVDYDELKSDMEWLKEYYAKESWNDVTRWLTNIDSTLRETFSCYMEALNKIQGNNGFKAKK